jgi:hypothetical protein
MGEYPMPLDLIAYPGTPGASCEIGPALLARSDPGCRSSDVRAALARADVIFCEEDPGPEILRLAAPEAVVEFVSGDWNHAAARGLSISRARMLASDGWRVVWLAPGGSAGLAADLGHDGLARGGIDDDAATAAPTPHVLATAFNGLAG